MEYYLARFIIFSSFLLLLIVATMGRYSPGVVIFLRLAFVILISGAALTIYLSQMPQPSEPSIFPLLQELRAEYREAIQNELRDQGLIASNLLSLSINGDLTEKQRETFKWRALLAVDYELLQIHEERIVAQVPEISTLADRIAGLEEKGLQQLRRSARVPLNVWLVFLFLTTAAPALWRRDILIKQG